MRKLVLASHTLFAMPGCSYPAENKADKFHPSQSLVAKAPGILAAIAGLRKPRPKMLTRSLPAILAGGARQCTPPPFYASILGLHVSHSLRLLPLQARLYLKAAILDLKASWTKTIMDGQASETSGSICEAPCICKIITNTLQEAPGKPSSEALCPENFPSMGGEPSLSPRPLAPLPEPTRPPRSCFRGAPS